MSVFANNRALAINLMKKAGSGDNLLKVLDMIAEDVKGTDKKSA